MKTEKSAGLIFIILLLTVIRAGSEELTISFARGAFNKGARENISTKYVGMVYVPSGNFIMGTDKGFPFEKPRRQVFVKEFYIDVNEVTNAQYKLYVDAKGIDPPAFWKNGKIPDGYENKPVTGVNYYDAIGYALWAGKRLPAEDEWEKAARGMDARIFPWGNKYKKNAANVTRVIFSKLKPVASCINGQSPYGCLDMAGNVSEWTDSWFEPYPGNYDSGHSKNSYGQQYKVIRGGSYKTSLFLSTTFRRDICEPTASGDDIGFRCVKD